VPGSSQRDCVLFGGGDQRLLVVAESILEWVGSRVVILQIRVRHTLVSKLMGVNNTSRYRGDDSS
jgi:hypothetical protein